MLTDDEAGELRVLQERVYGRSSSHTPDPADLRRLEELTRRRASPDAEERPPASTDAPTRPAVPSPTPPPEAPKRRWPWVVVGGLALAGLAFGAGMAWGTWSPSPSASTGVDLPEFSRPQTDEDILDIPGTDLDAASTRFIATTHGYDVFIGKSDEENLVCVILHGVSSADYTAGCQDQNYPIGVGASAASNFSVGIGDVAGLGLPGKPIPLSESVTAYASDPS